MAHAAREGDHRPCPGLQGVGERGADTRRALTEEFRCLAVRVNVERVAAYRVEHQFGDRFDLEQAAAEGGGAGAAGAGAPTGDAGATAVDDDEVVDAEIVDDEESA